MKDYYKTEPLKGEGKNDFGGGSESQTWSDGTGVGIGCTHRCGLGEKRHGGRVGLHVTAGRHPRTNVEG
jgi:hypothetical protein